MAAAAQVTAVTAMAATAACGGGEGGGREWAAGTEVARVVARLVKGGGSDGSGGEGNSEGSNS